MSFSSVPQCECYEINPRDATSDRTSRELITFCSTERDGREARAPVACSGGPNFESRPGDLLSSSPSETLLDTAPDLATMASFHILTPFIITSHSACCSTLCTSGQLLTAAPKFRPLLLTGPFFGRGGGRLELCVAVYGFDRLLYSIQDTNMTVMCFGIIFVSLILIIPKTQMRGCPMSWCKYRVSLSNLIDLVLVASVSCGSRDGVKSGFDSLNRKHSSCAQVDFSLDVKLTSDLHQMAFTKLISSVALFREHKFNCVYCQK
jgi:hypothetical protein